MRLRGMGLDKLDQRCLCRKESVRVRRTVSTSSTNGAYVMPANAGISAKRRGRWHGDPGSSPGGRRSQCTSVRVSTSSTNVNQHRDARAGPFPVG